MTAFCPSYDFLEYFLISFSYYGVHMCMGLLPSGWRSSYLYIVSSPLPPAVYVASDDLINPIFDIYSLGI